MALPQVTELQIDKRHELLSPLSRGVLLALMTVAMTACKPIRFLNLSTRSGDEVSVADYQYGPHERHGLSVYTPENPRATVYFFYGGSWRDGQREDYAFVGKTLSRRGYQVIIPDYRLYPEVRYPSFIEDAANAVAFSLCDMPGGVHDKRIVMGHSAGAHIAAVLTFNQSFLIDSLGQHEAMVSETTIFDAFVGLSGPYDFLPSNDPLLQAIFSDHLPIHISQPVNYVDGNEARALLIHGRKDRTVRIENTQSLSRTIESSGGQVTTRYYDDARHATTVIAFSGLGRPNNNRILSDVLEFIGRSDHAPAAPASGDICDA